MLINIFNWIYVIFTSFCLGYAFLLFAKKFLGYRIINIDSILVAGLIIATVYAEIWSLFGGVLLAANLVLCLFCVAFIFFFRRAISATLHEAITPGNLSRRIVICVLFLLWAYFGSRGYFAYDSDLYHGQSIRWIEEYGVVKGMGNLHERFAYNSSYFALSALYSMKFLFGRSLHSIGAYMAFLLSLTTLNICRAWKRKKFIWSDYARIAAIYYLTTITDEVSAPASDFAIMCMIFWIVIKWLDALEDDGTKNEIAPFALLCVAGAYALTLKLTAGLILILLIKPAVNLIKGKKWKEICIYLSLGLTVAVPWFIRTVLISGWLIYPFEGLDLFNVDWKINSETVALDAANIKTWARGLYNASLVDVPISEWFPGWFKGALSGTEKLLIIACLGEIILFAGIVITSVIRRNKDSWDAILVMFTMLSSYIFWQLSAPMMRYGYAGVLLTAVLPVGYILSHLKKTRIICLIVLLYGAYKLGMVGKYAFDSRLFGYMLWPQDYGQYELESYDVDGITIFYPVEGDRTGYDAFPTSPDKRDLELRGTGLRDGFR
ncbi:MAG: hypothetical protein K6D96_06970 [Acetatifactor sp.]|nr:hypothetical protein [Acetatifactor sp.]